MVGLNVAEFIIRFTHLVTPRTMNDVTELIASGLDIWFPTQEKQYTYIDIIFAVWHGASPCTYLMQSV